MTISLINCSRNASFINVRNFYMKISECLKARLSDKPEIGKANFSVHAQKSEIFDK